MAEQKKIVPAIGGKAETIRVVALVPVEHDGKRYETDDEFDVAVAQVAALEKVGAVKEVDAE